MTDSTPEPAVKFPDMSDAQVDGQTIRALMRDIKSHCTLLELRCREGRRANEDTSLDIDSTATWLDAGARRAVQLRYQFDGAEYWDTVMNIAPDVFRIVRVRHDWEVQQ